MITLQIAYRLYSNNVAIMITGFSFLAIKNRGAGNIAMTRGDVVEPVTAIYYVGAGEPFSWPYLGSAFDKVNVSAGNAYSIITDGVVTLI